MHLSVLAQVDNNSRKANFPVVHLAIRVDQPRTMKGLSNSINLYFKLHKAM